MEQQALFRKAALDKLASPERLDVLMQVTSPAGWLALLTTGAVLAGVVLWSIFGSIPTRVEGEGILIRGGSLREVKATGDGALTDFKIQVNDVLEQGQAVAEIAQPGMEDRILSARQRYEGMEREYEAATGEDRATLAARRAELRTLEEEMDVKQKSFEKGLITKKQLLQVERDMINLRAGLSTIEQRIRQRRLNVDASKREYEELLNMEASASSVASPVSGRVIEVKKSLGDRVRNGDVLAVVEPLSEKMEPVVFVASTQGKRIQPGMEAQISPSTVKREEFGFMKGTVATVGEYPVTPDAANAIVKNDALVRELLGNSSKIELRAALTAKPETPSGFEWSSSAGPPFKIASGTRVTVSVIVDRRAPITLILPIIKSTIGVS